MLASGLDPQKQKWRVVSKSTSGPTILNPRRCCLAAFLNTIPNPMVTGKNHYGEARYDRHNQGNGLLVVIEVGEVLKNCGRSSCASDSKLQ